MALPLRWCAWLLVPLCAPAAATVWRGDVVVSQPSGFVRLDPHAGVAVTLTVNPPPSQPVGTVVLDDGTLLVADWVDVGILAGHVLRIDLATRQAVTLTGSGPLPNPFALVRGPDGRIVLSDIDGGTAVRLPGGAILRKGVFFELDPATGGVTRLVGDCCAWNPVGFVFASPTELLVADAGCCAYSGPGNLARADLATGGWTPLSTSVAWRDPFAVALSADGATLYVAESAVSEPGLPAVRAVELVSGFTVTVREGAPFVSPVALLREADGRLLVADRGADAVFRLSPGDGAVETVVQGRPLREPGHLVLVDVGDDVGGAPAPSTFAALCATRASRAAVQLASRTLRCLGTRTGSELAACVARARLRFWSRPVPAGCPGCVVHGGRWIGSELPEALVRTPGQRLKCAAFLTSCRRSLGAAAGRLYRDLAACTAAYRAGAAPDAAVLHACRAAAGARFQAATARCDACTTGDRQAIAAQVRSLVDGFTGAWFCAR